LHLVGNISKEMKQHVSAYCEAIIRFTNVSYRRLIAMRVYVDRCWDLTIYSPMLAVLTVYSQKVSKTDVDPGPTTKSRVLSLDRT